MGEELTAPQCAKLTGLSLSATAYHLNLRERFQLRGRRRHRMRWLDPRASIRGPRADD
jgi:hypothetical protein